MKRTGQSKIAVVGWGRGMGHKGHMYLADAVIQQAKDMNADPYFFVSKTVGKDDPILPEEKVRIYQKVFPQYATIFEPQGNLNQALTDLAGLGYQGVVVVVGADQKEAFQYLVKPNKEGVPVFQTMGLKKLKVISRQETRSQYRGEEGPRATPMREILLDPNATEEDKFKVWRRDMPEQLSDREVLDIMNKAESRMMHQPAKQAKVKQMSQKVAKLKEAIQFLKTKKQSDPEKNSDAMGYKHLFKQPDEEQQPKEKRFHGWAEYDKEKDAEVAEGSDEALKYATQAHAGQTRSGGDPYITHPMRVADHIKQYKQSHNLDALISAAYLHDTIEDTSTTQEALHDLFGGLVASLVQELTSDPEEIKRVGKKQYLAHKMAAMSSYALVIKLADRLDNVKDITTAKTPEWRHKYAQETAHILDYIEKTRALSGTHRKLIELIRSKLAEIDNPQQGVAEGKYKCTCHPGDADPDCPVHGLEPMEVGDALDVKKGVTEGEPRKTMGLDASLDQHFNDKKHLLNPGVAHRGQLVTIIKAPRMLDLLPGETFEVSSSDADGVTLKHGLGTKFDNVKFPHGTYKIAKAQGVREGFDREEFRRHMEQLRAREELRKTDPVSAKALDLRGQLPQASKKKPEDDSMSINDPRHPGYAYTQMGQTDLNEFAPGNGDDDRPTAEYEVYQCSLDDQFDWIGGPLMQTDDMGKAHDFAYFLWKKHPDKCFMIWQERSQGSRGGYGPEGSVLAPSKEIDEVSDKTLVSYLTKVDADSRKHKMDPTKRSDKKASKSVSGFSKAFNKLDSRKPDGTVSEDYLDE